MLSRQCCVQDLESITNLPSASSHRQGTQTAVLGDGTHTELGQQDWFEFQSYRFRFSTACNDAALFKKQIFMSAFGF